MLVDQKFIDRYKQLVVQIATPYSTGTGFYLKDYKLIVTNEHVIRDNKKVVILGSKLKNQTAEVLYVDPYYDLAFISCPELNVSSCAFGKRTELNLGDAIIAMGHPFGLDFTATRGIISNLDVDQNGLSYYQHDAALNPGNSGGPLINTKGELVGLNTFVIRNGKNIGYTLPVEYLEEALSIYNPEQGLAVKCYSCKNISYEQKESGSYCSHCGAQVQYISDIPDYEPQGIQRSIEEVLVALGYDMDLSRKGPNCWEIQKGSAEIAVLYHQKSGLIIGDAFLCKLPEDGFLELYKYLLQQNYDSKGLTLSIKGQYIVISLLLYDQYLQIDTATHLFEQLFLSADHFDNILIEQFGAEIIK